MERTRRARAVALAVVAVAVALAAALAGARALASDGGPSFDDAVEQASALEAEGSFSASIDAAGAYAYFSFEPTVDGTYAVSTDGDADTLVYVYDDAGNVLAESDDGGAALNGLAAVELAAGQTYYLAFGLYDSVATGDFAAEVALLAAEGTCGADGSDAVTWALEVADDGTCTLTIAGTGPMADYAADDRPWGLYADTVDAVVVQEGVTHVGSYAFADFTALASASLPESLTTVGDYAFAACSALAEVRLPDAVESVGAGAFLDAGLTAVELPDGASLGSCAFEGCAGLADADGFVLVGGVLFDYCGTQTDVAVPDGTVAIGDWAFWGQDVESVTVSESVESIGEQAFFECESLTSVEVPDGCALGAGAFEGCTGLADAEGFVLVGGVLFDYCGDQVDVAVPDGTVAISAYAFYDLEGVESVTVPAGVESVGALAFAYCADLQSVLFEGDAPAFALSDDEDAAVFCGVSATVLYPSGADGWDEASAQDLGGSLWWAAFGGFSDVTDAAKYYFEPVYALAGAGYVTGTTTSSFSPNGTLTRAQMVAVLWRICCPEDYEELAAAGYADTANTTAFTDVAADRYYTAAVAWAVEEGIVKGTSETSFSPNGTCTFQMFCTILGRALAGGDDALEQLFDDDAAADLLGGFDDADDMAAYAVCAMAYCVDEGLVNGYSDGTLRPVEDVSRARMSTLVYRALAAGLFDGVSAA